MPTHGDFLITYNVDNTLNDLENKTNACTDIVLWAKIGFGRSLVLPLFQLIEVKAANKLFYNGNHGVFLQMCQFSPGLFGPHAPPYYQTDVSIGYI